MKYWQLFKRYFWVFVGAVLFGLTAVRVKSAQRGERKANDKLRDAQEEDIDRYDKIINKRVDNLKRAEARSQKVRDNAIKRLDTIKDNSESVGSLLTEYNANRNDD
jgi:hypothetical protein